MSSSLFNSLIGGFAGACTVTLLNETARRVLPDAPRLDVLGMRGIARPMRAAGLRPPGRTALRGLALSGDLVANTLYYALAGMGDKRNAPWRGAALGIAAGVGAVTLPPVLGLGRAPVQRTAATEAMTVAWYTLAGVAAGAVTAITSGAGRS